MVCLYLLQESVNFLKQVISVDWIQANGLKFLVASLHNVGVALYRNKQVKEVFLEFIFYRIAVNVISLSTVAEYTITKCLADTC